MPRGGRRPGAGAPRGNTNAVRHGKRSRRYAEATTAIKIFHRYADDDTARAILLPAVDAGLILRSGVIPDQHALLRYMHPLLMEFLRTKVPAAYRALRPRAIDCLSGEQSTGNQRSAPNRPLGPPRRPKSNLRRPRNAPPRPRTDKQTDNQTCSTCGSPIANPNLRNP